MTIAVDVLGLGNSLIDIIAYADDANLSAQEMLKGAMTLIDEDRAETLYAVRGEPSVVSGGVGRQHHCRRRLVRSLSSRDGSGRRPWHARRARLTPTQRLGGTSGLGEKTPAKQKI
jgi:hypothetical protein